MSRGLCLPQRLLASAVFWAGLFAIVGATRASAANAAAPLPPAQRVSLHTFARGVGLEASWLERNKKLRLKSRTNELVFELDRREVLINGARVFLGEAPLPGHRTLTISTVDRDRLLLPILAPQRLELWTPVRVIALDAGHGGKDTGTHSNSPKLDEKDLTLDVVRRLKPMLEARGFKVVLTRTDDTFIELLQRPAKSAAARADIFISVHFNAGPAEVHGLETYILTPQHQRSTGSDTRKVEDDVAAPGNRFDEWSANLGYTVHRQLRSGLGLFDRGLKHARFVVLAQLPCPGVLIEGGYLSNSAEAKLVATPAFREKLASNIAAAVLAYHQTLVQLAQSRGAKSTSAN